MTNPSVFVNAHEAITSEGFTSDQANAVLMALLKRNMRISYERPANLPGHPVTREGLR